MTGLVQFLMFLFPARVTLYLNYATALTKGDSKEVDEELDKIEELIRKGEELNIFQ